jgi:hypothetical protein
MPKDLMNQAIHNAAERVLPTIRARESHPAERRDHSLGNGLRVQPPFCEDRLAATVLRFSAIDSSHRRLPRHVGIDLYKSMPSAPGCSGRYRSRKF